MTIDEIDGVGRALEELPARRDDDHASYRDFISTASHELRTPLSTLQATLELLKELTLGGALEPDQIVAHADTALRQTYRLVALATDLLDVSRVHGDASLERAPIELDELTSAIASEFVARLQSAGRSVRVEGGPAVAVGDRAAAARILRILVDNASKYGDGTVIVRVSTGAPHARVVVEDRGPGLASDEHERIFGRFARGRAAARGTGGAGLGLAIARDMARAMGGDLKAVPVPVGARFVLTLGSGGSVAR